MKKSVTSISSKLKNNGYVILKSSKIEFLRKVKRDYFRIAKKMDLMVL